MGLFSKKETIFDERNRPLWEKVREALKEAGIKAKCSYYDVDPPFVSCGCKLDVRDFGENGKIDRKMYYVSVKVEDLEKAKSVVETVRAQNLNLELKDKNKVSYY